MDQTVKWMIVVSLILCEYVVSPAHQSVPTSPPETTASGTTSTHPKTHSPSNNSTTGGSTPRGGLAEAGATIGSVFKGLVKGFVYLAKNLWSGLIWTGNALRIVWRHVMNAGVYVFHAQYKTIIVLIRWHRGLRRVP